MTIGDKSSLSETHLLYGMAEEQKVHENWEKWQCQQAAQGEVKAE